MSTRALSTVGVFLFASVLSVAAVRAADTSPVPFDGCGELIYSSIEGGCWSLRDDDGKTYLLPPRLKDDFRPNDKVHITGSLLSPCACFCDCSDGCLYIERIEFCAGAGAEEASWGALKTYYR